MVKLDVKDKKILSILDMDARLPLSIIAKKVRLSRDVVNYRIKQLEKKGIIEGYYSVIDVAKLGMFYCRTFFKYKNIRPEVEKEIIYFCNNHKDITWVIIGEGQYDISIMIIADSLDIIESTYDEINSKFGKYLQEPYISLAFRIYHYKHNYLYGTNDLTEYVMGNKNILKVDKKDLKLIGVLADNARVSLIGLAKRLKTTPKLISYRIKKLISNKIILVFRAKINTRLLGYDTYKIFLTLQNFDEQNKSKLITYLRNHPNVVYITKPMGTHNLEFEIMVKNMGELHDKMKEIKILFADIVFDYETNLYYDEPLVTYFPSLKKSK